MNTVRGLVLDVHYRDSTGRALTAVGEAGGRLTTTKSCYTGTAIFRWVSGNRKRGESTSAKAVDDGTGLTAVG